eukprot:CAMPEP_0117685168 /NCGR_PEP_ID=MMETSP0804-20121206/21574_1 /TAXON_ID=1074897 /ORGANISM="Tetraselmis astigmatica, Strain CCMP880" /LENGTH=568 /DNA_ID=CAMNT_0005496379 /DNA_START=104 /DNA_END=1811 /DNA_ORIENTATION=-
MELDRVEDGLEPLALPSHAGGGGEGLSLGRKHTRAKDPAAGRFTYDLHVCRQLCLLRPDANQQTATVHVSNRRVFIHRAMAGSQLPAVEEVDAGMSAQLRLGDTLYLRMEPGTGKLRWGFTLRRHTSAAEASKLLPEEAAGDGQGSSNDRGQAMPLVERPQTSTPLSVPPAPDLPHGNDLAPSPKRTCTAGPEGCRQPGLRMDSHGRQAAAGRCRLEAPHVAQPTSPLEAAQPKQLHLHPAGEASPQEEAQNCYGLPVAVELCNRGRPEAERGAAGCNTATALRSTARGHRRDRRELLPLATDARKAAGGEQDGLQASSRPQTDPAAATHGSMSSAAAVTSALGLQEGLPSALSSQLRGRVAADSRPDKAGFDGRLRKQKHKLPARQVIGNPSHRAVGDGSGSSSAQPWEVERRAKQPTKGHGGGRREGQGPAKLSVPTETSRGGKAGIFAGMVVVLHRQLHTRVLLAKVLEHGGEILTHHDVDCDATWEKVTHVVSAPGEVEHLKNLINLQGSAATRGSCGGSSSSAACRKGHASQKPALRSTAKSCLARDRSLKSLGGPQEAGVRA